MNYMTLEEVLDRGYAKEIYEYALDYPIEDANMLTNEFLKSKRLPDHYDYSYLDFMSFDDDYDDDEFDYPDWEDEPLEYYYYVFARDIKGANIELLQQAIIDSEREDFIYLFARDIEGANIELLQKEMRYGDPKYIYLFAYEVMGSNAEVLQNHLIAQMGEGYDWSFREVLLNYMLKFAEDIEGTNIDKMISEIDSFINEYHANGNIYHHELMDMRFDDYIEELDDFINELRELQNNKTLRIIKK